MLSFENDYSCTATPEIIERISEIAQNQYPGYGNDSICERPGRQIEFVAHRRFQRARVEPYRMPISALFKANLFPEAPHNRLPNALPVPDYFHQNRHEEKFDHPEQHEKPAQHRGKFGQELAADIGNAQKYQENARKTDCIQRDEALFRLFFAFFAVHALPSNA